MIELRLFAFRFLTDGVKYVLRASFVGPRWLYGQQERGGF